MLRFFKNGKVVRARQPARSPRVADGRVFRGPPHLGQRVSKLIPAGAFIYILSHIKTKRNATEQIRRRISDALLR